jgi:alkanesulfonate monooxygenase SsuD/methylene tetrahydromethanopterin reductase-like flavin-dependent oxidoreductase (luciferase family)
MRAKQEQREKKNGGRTTRATVVGGYQVVVEVIHAAIGDDGLVGVQLVGQQLQQEDEDKGKTTFSHLSPYV